MNVKIPEIMGTDDLHAKLTWEDFEKRIQPIVDKIDTVLNRVFSSPYV